jgi:hypothetical protein
MKTSLTQVALATTLLSALAFGLPAHAAEKAAPAGPASTQPAKKVIPPVAKKTALKAPSAQALSQDGYQAVRDMSMARVAIFQGDTQAASELLRRAERAIDVVDRAAAVRATDVKNVAVVIDSKLVVADNFVDTPKKRTHIAKANEHIAQGRSKEAHEELRLAEVDAALTQVLMPLDTTRRHLNAAITLLTAKQYYEANLALKAVEDGLLTETVAVRETLPPTAN